MNKIGGVIMNDIEKELKNLFYPEIPYEGTWTLGEIIKDISSKDSFGNDLYEKFLDRYYYKPLESILKDKEIVKTFHLGYCSYLKDGQRNLYFSKREFLKNIISNIDELIESETSKNLPKLKKALRDKKDTYRDCAKQGSESPFYNEIEKEYRAKKLDIPFPEYVALCQKKYTKILSGYNAILAFFDRPINIFNFISCFDSNQLYLYTCYSILKNCQVEYELYGRISTNENFIATYQNIVEKVRKKEPFYNTFITFNEDDKTRIYTPDDLIKDYTKLLDTVNN